MTIELQGRIDTGNADGVGKVIMAKMEESGEHSLVLDAAKLDYISSAGLRMILQLKKAYGDLRVTHVKPHIYDVFEITGFTEMIQVEKEAPESASYAREIEVDALTENLFEVQAFVDECLEAVGCPMKVQMQIALAVEEIFVNIASYAYVPHTGKARIRVETSETPHAVSIVFTDRGIPYDPLAKEDPDVTLKAEERSIGGLGIYMTKKVMDEVTYEYRDSQNILTMTKYLGK